MHQLTLPEGTLAYDDQGSGPLVIMLPGMGDLRQNYRFLAPKLVGAGYRAVTLDLRGHGGSSTGWQDYSVEATGHDILALIEQLDAGPATVIGTSFSAASAVWAAAENPEAISGLVLVGPFVRDAEISPVQRAAMQVLFNGPWRVRAWDWFYGTLYPTRKPEDFASYHAALRANLAEPGRFEALQGLMAASKAPATTRLPDVKAPTLVLMGSKDPDFPDPAAEAHWIAEQLSGQVALIDGAGHYPHTEMPELSAPKILEFLSEVGDTRGAQTRIK